MKRDALGERRHHWRELCDLRVSIFLSHFSSSFIHRNMSLMLFTHYLLGYVGKKKNFLNHLHVNMIRSNRLGNVFHRSSSITLFRLRFYSSSNGKKKFYVFSSSQSAHVFREALSRLIWLVWALVIAAYYVWVCYFPSIIRFHQRHKAIHTILHAYTNACFPTFMRWLIVFNLPAFG